MQLQELSLGHEAAFLTMLADYESGDPALYAALYKRKWDKKEFQAYVAECQKLRQDWRPKAGKTSITRYVLVGLDGRIYGNGSMRFPLDDKIEKTGGNLVVDIPPSLRGQGYGTITLNRMLFEAVRAGLARVLETCPVGDLASRKILEKNRGELESERDGLARYWIRFR